MTDYHIHTSLSADSQEEMENYCLRALKLGIGELCFTEHIDAGYPYDMVFMADLEAYDERIAKMRRKYPQLILRQGLEAGLMPETLAETERLLNRELDFVIASQHVVQGRDPYMSGFFDGRTNKEAYEEYLQEMLFCLQHFHRYSVVGHIGYPSKYCPHAEKNIRYEDHADVIDAILKQVISDGKGLEVNTVSQGITGEDMPVKSILKRYRELGGEILTIGSDSHRAETLGRGYARAAAYLKDMGFKYLCTFEKMKPVFHGI